MMFWKVVYVNSRAEKKVAQRLGEKGIVNYVPLKKEMKQWSDRKKVVKTPMINGYVFVQPKDLHQRDAVLQQQGVIQYLRYNGSDAIVREIEIEALRSIEDKGYYVDGAFGSGPELGSDTLIKYGPFKGLKGKITSLQNEDIYSVVIESIGYNLTLKVPKETLARG